MLLRVLELAFHQLKRHKHVAHELSESGLVVDRAFHALEDGACALVDPVAPDIDNAVRAAGRFCAREPFADHQRQRVLERRILTVDVAVGQALILAGEFRAEILRDAAHAKSAQRLDARALDSIEDRLGFARRRRERSMQGGVVMRNQKRDGIGETANDSDFLAAHRAARLRQADGLAVEARRLRAENHIHRFVFGERSRRKRKGALEGRQRIGLFFRRSRHCFRLCLS